METWEGWRELAEWPHRGGVTPREWGVEHLTISPGGLRPESRAGRELAARAAELDRHAGRLRRWELRLTVLSYSIAFALALEVLLALVVVGYGNRRLATPISGHAVSRPAVAGRR